MGLWLCGLLGVSGAAFAQQVPPPRVGFQMDIRTGYSIPMGNAFSGVAQSKLSDSVSGQVPVIVDIGGKVIPELFLGGYLGLGFGGVAGSIKQACDAINASCLAVGVHLGVEAQYHILPGGSANPWLGYGLGLESLGFSISQGNTTQSASYSGFEFARLSGGVDFRISRVFGIGPFIDLSLARYSTFHDGNDDIELTNKATHQWLTLGARAVIFP